MSGKILSNCGEGAQTSQEITRRSSVRSLKRLSTEDAREAPVGLLGPGTRLLYLIGVRVVGIHVSFGIHVSSTSAKFQYNYVLNSTESNLIDGNAAFSTGSFGIARRLLLINYSEERSEERSGGTDAKAL